MRSKIQKYVCVFMGLALISGLSFIPVAQAETDRAEVERIIKEYLRENPDVIVDSLELFRAQQEREMQAQAAKTIDEKMDYLTSADAPSVGSKDADVTVVEFFDYNCGYCKRVIPDMQAILKNDDKVRIVFREMPILGPTSMTAAQWALAAHKQGRYFDFHVALMQHRGQKDAKSLERLAKNMGLDVEKMKKDAESADVKETIVKDMNISRDIGIRGTPAFIINGELHRGYLGKDGFIEAIESAREKGNNKEG